MATGGATREEIIGRIRAAAGELIEAEARQAEAIRGRAAADRKLAGLLRRHLGPNWRPFLEGGRAFRPADGPEAIAREVEVIDAIDPGHLEVEP